MKKYIFLITSIMLLMSSMSYGVSFKDVSTKTSGYDAIQNMTENGYINGYPDGTFKPNNTITRAEFVTVVNKMNNFTVESKVVFSDVSSSHWAYKEIAKAVNAGYIKGFPNGTFRPNDNITREQVASMLVNLYKFEDKATAFSINDLAKASTWAIESVVSVVFNKIMPLDTLGNFSGKRNATRLESVQALNQVIVLGFLGEDEVVAQVPESIIPPSTTNPVQPPSVLDPKTRSDLETVVTSMNNYVNPVLKTSLQIQLSNIITSSINKYLSDANYSIDGDKESARLIVNQMNQTEKDFFKKAIQANVEVEPLVALNNVFQLIEY